MRKNINKENKCRSLSTSKNTRSESFEKKIEVIFHKDVL